MDTYTSYRLIARDMPKALARVEKQPTVDRDTDYYLANIGKVKTVDQFVKDDRLFRYAMKAHGLEDMTYAKAFMVKALKDGIASPDSFANKLSDKRYAEFVKSYNFAAYGDQATTYNQAQVEVPKNYKVQAQIAGLPADSAYVKTETAYYAAQIGKITSVDGLMKDDRLVTYVLAAYGLDDTAANIATMRKSLDGGVADPKSFVNTLNDNRFKALATAFDFQGKGATVTTVSNAQRPVVDKFVRQTLEQSAGQQDEGVRLALYFERKAPTLTSFYEVLADKALSKVVRTMLSLPDSFAAADIDRQVSFFESKLDLKDFSDPEKLGKMMTRFTNLYGLANGSAAGSASSASAAVLFSQSASLGVSASTLFAINTLKR